MTTINLRCPNCGNVFPSPVQFGGNVVISGNVSIGATCPKCSHQFSLPVR